MELGTQPTGGESVSWVVHCVLSAWWVGVGDDVPWPLYACWAMVAVVVRVYVFGVTVDCLTMKRYESGKDCIVLA
jgi:hypothetical protein